MNTTIAQQKDGKWYVVESKVICGTVVWYPISKGYDTSLEARQAQASIIFGR